MKMKLGNILLGLFVVLNLFGVLMAAGEEKNIGVALGELCGTVKSALAVGMLLLVVLAAVVYAVGQVMGAETRARASVWATAMFVGAIMGALLYILLPFIMSILMTGKSDSTWMTTCCKTGMTQGDVDACGALMKTA